MRLTLVSTKHELKGDIRHRDPQAVAFDDEEFTETLFDRMELFVPQEVIMDKDRSNLGLKSSIEQLYGRWKPYRLNSHWRGVVILEKVTLALKEMDAAWLLSTIDHSLQ